MQKEYYGMRDAYEDNVLSHHGILGQKWGIRRFQNPDGSLTPAGRERYRKQIKKKIEKGFVYDDKYNVGYGRSKSYININGSKTRTTVYSYKENEKSNIKTATDFIEDYDFKGCLKDVIDEGYDSEYSWIDKNPKSPNYVSKDAFKKTIKLDDVIIDPDEDMYSLYYDAGEHYGGHVFAVYGSISSHDDKNKRKISLEG